MTDQRPTMNESFSSAQQEPNQPADRDPDIRVRVDLVDRSYDIVIASGMLDRAGDLVAPFLNRPRTVIVTDRNVAAHQLPRLSAALDASTIEHSTIVLEPGESRKDFVHFEELANLLLDAEVERDDVILALGGGVVGDLTGLVASVLRRGVRIVQIPTTLLAQVDSSVGGKTGINTVHGKNLIGTFHQPALVLADWSALDTLSGRELRAGYAEIVKYGLLGNAEFFAWLEANGAAVLDGTGDARGVAIAHACRAKAEIVAADERESGQRALLNLGHTFAHAIEAELGYAQILHGEAVSLGLVLAFALSARLDLCPVSHAERVRAHLAAIGLPTIPADCGIAALDLDRLIGHIRQDKKVADGTPAFVLATAIGDTHVRRDIDLADVRDLLAATWGT